MALDVKQVNQIIQRPKHRGEIARALHLQRRLRFHTEPHVSMRDVLQPATEFLEWVKGLLPKDKYAIFLQLFKFPLATSTIVEDAYRELRRVFQSRNASASYQFSSSNLLDDWLAYKKHKLHEPDVWKDEGWRHMATSPNSILVVDLPVEQTSLRPEPYFYWLEIDRVIDYELLEDGAFNWLIFWSGDHQVAVFDKDSISVYKVNDKLEVVSVVSEAQHDLGYCLARFFWTDRVSAMQPELKRNPIVKELSNLDWYLFFHLSKRHLDTYAPYPIYSAYEADCDFENNETGDYCDGGYLRDINGHFKLLSNGAVMPCPCCSERRIAGPGSFLEVPVPNQAEGIVDMRNPVQITTIDRESLDYNVDECERLKEEIIDSIIGQGETVSTKEAVNETQVTANFESKISVLTALKTNFERAEKFVNDTICRLRYGSEFISSYISWGTQFYMFSTDDLYKKLKAAQEVGANASEIDAIMQQIQEVEYQDNPTDLQRQVMLRFLEPYPNYTFDQLKDLQSEGLLDALQYIVKLNFISFISRFELENVDITQFGISRPLADRIKIISKKLQDYAKEELENIKSRDLGRGQSVQGATDRVIGYV